MILIFGIIIELYVNFKYIKDSLDYKKFKLVLIND